MNAPTQLDPELSRTATRLRSAAPNAASVTRPALADIQRGARHRRTRRRMASGAAAIIVLGALTATTIAVRRDDGSTASQTLNDPIDVAIAQTQPLVPTLGPGEKFDYAIVQGDPNPPIDPDQIVVFSDVAKPSLANRSIVAVISSLSTSTTPISSDFGTITTIGSRRVALSTDPSGTQAQWTQDGLAVWLTGRNLTESELTSFIDSILVVGFDIRDRSNPTATAAVIGMRQVSSRPRPASVDLTLQWGMSSPSSWTLETFTGTSLLSQFGLIGAGEQIELERPTGRPVATLFRGGNGLALAWEEPAGIVRILSAQQSADVVRLVSMAESLSPIDSRSLRSMLETQQVTLETHIADDPGSVDASTTQEATSVATTAVESSTSGDNRIGDSASLSTGPIFMMTDDGLHPATEILASAKVPLGIIRTSGGEPWALMLYESNPAGGCFITPIPGASISDPDAPFFSNECDHSTYTMDGRCLDGCTVGLYATKLEEHDGAIWGDITNYDKRRPKA